MKLHPYFKACKIALVALTMVSCSKNNDPEIPGTDPTPTPTPAFTANAVPIAKNFNAATSVDFASKNAVVDFFSGEHPVAIYRTPDGKSAEIGKGKLLIARSGNNFSMKLEASNSNAVATATVDLTNTTDYNYETLLKAGVLYNIGASERLGVVRTDIKFTAQANGSIAGEVYVDGVLFYRFRNNVEHFGLTAPPAITALAGTWEGAHLQPLCQPNPVTLTIAADGAMVLKGKSALNCAPQEITNKWDGQDDYVAPAITGWTGTHAGSMIYLDGAKSGGSQPGGGIWILVPQLTNPSGILEVQSYTALSGGNILVEKPAKK